jgi:hypothetical protein
MKKLTVILTAVILLFNMSGCFRLISAIGGCDTGDSSSSPPPVLRCYDISPLNANGYLEGLELTSMFNAFDKATGYTYGQGYERFVFTKSAPSLLNISVVPNGKRFDEAFTIDGGSQKTVNGLEISYTVSRKRHEDFYSFKTSAIVVCGGDTAYIRYNYTSKSSECELVALIDALFEARG